MLSLIMRFIGCLDKKKVVSCSPGVCHQMRRQGDVWPFFSVVVGGVDKHRLCCFCLMGDRS